MAGRARLQALKDEINSRTLAYFDIDPVDVATGSQQIPSHLEYVCARVEDGCTTKALCRELTPTLGYELTYDRLMRYLRDSFGDEVTSQALDAARSRASHCMTEQALEIVDAPAYDSVTVQQARARANQRNWMAERYNPGRFGQSKQTNVSISITALHLDALRAMPNRVTVASSDTVRNTLPSGSEAIQVIDA